MRSTYLFQWAKAGLALTALAVSGTALAATTEFNFDNLAGGGGYPNVMTGPAITSGGINQGPTASSLSIQNYMDSVLGCANCVTVTGALANSGYTGDNNVVKPSGSAYRTLANYNDTTVPGSFPGGSLNHIFIMNDNFGLYGAKSDKFTMSFTGGIVLDSVAFDWEIFPDGSCKTLTATGCGGTGLPNKPTLSFYANNTLVHTYTYNDPKATFSAGSSSVAPQAVGGLDSWNIPGTTSLTFQDWPAEVAVRGFEIKWHRTPEPGSLSLVGVALAGLGIIARRRRTPNT